MRFGLIPVGDGSTKLMFYISENVEDMICSKCKRPYQVKDKQCLYCHGAYALSNPAARMEPCPNTIHDEVTTKQSGKPLYTVLGNADGKYAQCYNFLHTN